MRYADSVRRIRRRRKYARVVRVWSSLGGVRHLDPRMVPRVGGVQGGSDVGQRVCKVFHMVVCSGLGHVMRMCSRDSIGSSQWEHFARSW